MVFMSFKDHIIVIGASAGGVEALTELVSSLPSGLPASVFVVQHLSPNYVSCLPAILSKKCALSVSFAIDGEKFEAGKIYIAPTDHHLLVDKDKVFATRGPKENRFRPSVDALFRSAAYCHGTRVIGIVLSGALDDGTSGLWSIKRMGGTTIVQDPDEAAFNAMPSSALEQVDIDYCLSVKEIGPLLIRLTGESTMKKAIKVNEDSMRFEMEVSIATDGDAFRKGIMEAAQLTPFTCPECHGVLVQVNEGKIKRYRCHTGHAYSRSALLSEITEKTDESYWSAMRSLEEAAMLLKQMGDDLAGNGQDKAAALFFEKERIITEQSHQLRDTLLNSERFSAESLLKKAEEE
jgi:two-component system chemotaxis response regulator CheB